jgi:hypothetical protein
VLRCAVASDVARFHSVELEAALTKIVSRCLTFDASRNLLPTGGWSWPSFAVGRESASKLAEGSESQAEVHE